MEIPIPSRTAREQFDRQAPHYNAQWAAWNEASLCWMLDHAEADRGDAVLDVATGAGYTALGFARHVRSVVGLDIAPGMLRQAEGNARESGAENVTFREGAAEEIPFGDAVFDMVTARVAPHHFLSIPRFIAEAARVLKPGGRLLLADSTVPDDLPEAAEWQNRVEVLRDPSHIRNYSPNEWRRFVGEAGLTIEEMTDVGLGMPITMNDWLVKSGCTPDQSAAVREAFDSAPDSAVRHFRVESLPGGDVGFVWQGVALKARKAE